MTNFLTKLIVGALLLSLAFIPQRLSAAPSDSLYSLPLKWVDDTGKPLSLSVFSGKFVVLTMAYTSCRSSCPLTFQRLTKIEHDLNAQNKSVDFVIVSLDPEVDTPETLAAYRKSHKLAGANWHLLRGEKADTRRLSHLVGISFEKEQDSGEIMHSNSIQLLSPEGKIILSLTGLGADIAPLLEKVPAQR